MSSILKVDTIQDQAGNNIISEAANVITIGASGDTITSVGTFTSFRSTGIYDNSTSNALFINSSNRVTVGTDSGYGLDNSADDFVVANTGSNSGMSIVSNASNSSSIFFTDTGSSSIGKIVYSHSSNDMKFTTTNSEAMRITSAGLVGIGTSSPAHNLEIVTTASGSVNDSLQIRNNSAASGTGSRIRFINSTDSASDANGASISCVRIGGDNDLVFETENSEAMRIDHTGKIGIGTSSPSTLLHLSSTSPVITFEETDQSNRKFQIGSFGNAYGLYDATNSQYRYIVDNSGNHIFNEGGLDCDFRVESNNNANMLFVDGNGDRVGIGTSNPDAQFQTDVASATIGGGRIYTNAVRTGVNSSALFSVRADNASGSSSGDIVNIQGDGVGDLLTLNNNGTDRVTVQADGKVGIGTSSPSTILHVKGTGAEQINLETTGGATTILAIALKNSANTWQIENGRASNVLSVRCSTYGETIRSHSNGVTSFNAGIALGVGLNNTSSNVLDDYEEGTFTPAFSFASGSIVHSAQNGVYTKVGRMVNFSAYLHTSGLNSPSGNAEITGLPFAVQGEFGGNVGIMYRWATANLLATLTPRVSGSGIQLFIGNSNIEAAHLQGSDFNGGSVKNVLLISGTYPTT